MGKVSLVKTDRGVKESLSHALDLIGGLGRYISCSDRVMLKPNLNVVDAISYMERMGLRGGTPYPFALKECMKKN